MNDHSPSAPPEAAALPVVGYGFFSGHGNHFLETVSQELRELAHGGNFVWAPLTRQIPAQAALDTLAAEVGRLTGELAAFREMVFVCKVEPAGAALPDVEAVMELSQTFANAHAMAFYANPELAPDSDEIIGRMRLSDAAREALRSALTRNPIGVGE